MAKGVRAKLTESPYLSVTARINANDRPLMVTAIMAKDKVKTMVYDGDKCIAAIAASGRRAQEYVPKAPLAPNRPARSVVVEYDVPSADVAQGKVSNPFLIDDDLACSFGDMSESWVTQARDMTHSDFVYDAIANSKFIGREDLNGRNCMMFRQTVETPSRTVVHTFHVDDASMEVWRWDSTQTREPPRPPIVRTREYVEIVHAAKDDGWKWRLELKDLVKTDPAAGGHDHR